jgi:hypothetical protein
VALGWLILKGTSPFAPTAPSIVLTELVDEDQTDNPR